MSETLPLSADRLRELYEIFRSTVVSSNWYRENSRRHLELVERVHRWSAEELEKPAAQKDLWESRALGSIGAGQNVDTSIVYADRAVTSALTRLRLPLLPAQPEQRAQAVQLEYDRILNMVYPRLSKRRPTAKLLRVFATLMPEDFYRCFNWKFQQQISQLVLGRVTGRVPGPVLVRHQLRQALGEEGDLAVHVERAFFCWWLHEYYERLMAGEQNMAELSAAEPAALADDEQSTPLALWSFPRQRKAMPTVSGYVNTLRAMLQSCEGGASQDDVSMALREEHGVQLNARNFRYLMSTAKALGLLDHRDGLWWPSDAGRETLETDPPDILVERMIERVFGVAQLLRLVKQRGPLSRGELFDELRPLYPGLRTDHWPQLLLAWTSSVELMEHDAQRWRLTDYGSGWADRLPDVLPSASAELTARDHSIDDDEDATGIAPFARHEDHPASRFWEPPSLAAVWDEFDKDDILRRFVFDRDQLAELHLAWHPPEDVSRASKRFVILSGLSGTGKTAILTHYARIYCRLVGIGRPDDHCTVVAVSPDWRDPSGLLGYVNALTPEPTYLREPALAHLLAARANPHRPYFLILDEMNLAHPEHYFAPFLSAMETGGRLDLHAHDSPLIDVPPAIDWPRNLFIGGTVNMDETTHAFSDKVLDRAFTIELWDVDLPRFFERRRDRDAADVADVDALYAFFIELNGELARVRRHVGYRSVGEAIDFVRSGARAGLAPDAQALWSLVDRAVHAKVLPRLRGHDRDELRKALDTARQVCAQRGLTRCASKLARMLAQLDEAGVTRFFA